MAKFTEAEDLFIIENYLTIPTKRISKLLGRSESGARQRMKILGLVVPPEIIDKFKIESHFKKGNISKNKGKRQQEYMSNEAIERSRKTVFKKGHIPHNAKDKNFVVSVRADKRGVKYKFIRISLGCWIPLARFNWEKVNGKIANGMKLCHKDGDTMNCEISNLELLTPGELMKRNSVHNYPKEIALTIQLTGALNRKINRKKRELNEK